jgi:hypothetical protein
MRPSLNIFFGCNVRITHRTQRPLPYPHHFIHQQILRHRMGDEHHRHLALELVDGDGEVFGGGGIQAAGGFVEDQYLGLLEGNQGNQGSGLAK